MPGPMFANLILADLAAGLAAFLWLAADVVYDLIFGDEDEYRQYRRR